MSLPPEPPEYPAAPEPGYGYPPPPPPAYPATGRQPATARRGPLGWLTGAGAAGLGAWKYFAVLKAFTLTGGTLLLSYGLYALSLGAAAAAGIVLMILVHEMGHVIEIRRQGMRATAPVFIPFMGAAIFQRQMAPDALRQAQIGIAGPLAGTLGATAAFVFYGSTHNPTLLVWAWFGFMINLFNLIPAGMLDGGWILAPVSKWFQVAGLGVLALLVLGPMLFGVGPVMNPIFLLVVVLGLPATIARFRNAGHPYYTSVPPAARLGIGAAWLALVLYLVIAMLQTESMLGVLAG